jgi:hypothetical protein
VAVSPTANINCIDCLKSNILTAIYISENLGNNKSNRIVGKWGITGPRVHPQLRRNVHIVGRFESRSVMAVMNWICRPKELSGDAFTGVRAKKPNAMKDDMGV